MNIPAITRMLTLSIGFTVSLILFRIFYAQNLGYLFIVWNLFLAMVPLIISTRIKRSPNKPLAYLKIFIWLLFFPNALYIVTDLVHLTDPSEVPMWFDMILLFSAAFNGLIMAFVSLRQVERFFLRYFNTTKSSVILLGCLFASSFGVYLGRYLRWNTWDVITNPFDLSADIAGNIINPLDHVRTWAITIILTGFFSVFYFTIKNLAVYVSQKENTPPRLRSRYFRPF